MTISPRKSTAITIAKIGDVAASPAVRPGPIVLTLSVENVIDTDGTIRPAAAK